MTSAEGGVILAYLEGQKNAPFVPTVYADALSNPVLEILKHDKI